MKRDYDIQLVCSKCGTPVLVGICESDKGVIHIPEPKTECTCK